MYAVKMEYWGRFCKVVNRIFNHEIKKRMSVEKDAGSRMEETRVQWYAYIRRTRKSRWIHQRTDWSPRDCRKRRRIGRIRVINVCHKMMKYQQELLLDTKR